MKNSVICLLYPIGIKEEDLNNKSAGSIQTIGTELYLSLKQDFNELDLELYEPNKIYQKNCVLLILSTLSLTPTDVLDKFDKIAYWFDDIIAGKIATQDDYKTKVTQLSLIAHPVSERVKQLNASLLPSDCLCQYVPWTIFNSPVKIEKSAHPSILLDLDDRPPYIQSIERAINFANCCKDLEVEIFIPKKYQGHFDEIKGRAQLSFFKPMPHHEYLNLLTKAWCYASGIPGSYEYSALESAYCGCGLISISNALPNEHAREFSFINTSTTTNLKEELLHLFSTMNSDEIISHAKSKYPKSSTAKIEELLTRKFFKSR